MPVTNMSAQRILAPQGPAEAGFDGAGTVARLAALEEELRRMRQEFATMRDMILEREKSGRTLLDAYKEVIADFADLFEAQRKEGVKREESLRFFLNSIEGRIRADIRAELGTNAAEPAISGRVWPFRRRG